MAHNKFAVVSHILPPSPSGQALVLARLLSRNAPDSYCLLSRENYGDVDVPVASAAKLPAPFFWLRPSPRVPVIPIRKLSAVCIALNALIAIYCRAGQIERVVRREGCGLVVACSGDLYDLPAAAIASRRTGVPLVAYIFDDYAYQWVGIHRSISRWLEPFILKHAKGVIVPNEYMQKEYQSRHGIDSIVIHNPCIVPDLDALDNAGRVFDDTEISIVYAGAIYHAHYDAFRNLIAALEHLGRNNVRLHLYSAQPLKELRANGIVGPMVVCHPHIPQTEVPRVLRSATLLFLPLAFDTTISEVIRTSAPGKTGDYLAAGKPIVAHVPDDSFVSRYFRKQGCGIVVGKNDPVLLAEEIARVMDDPALQRKLGKAARQMAERDFSTDKITTKFIDFITTCLEKSHGHG